MTDKNDGTTPRADYEALHTQIAQLRERAIKAEDLLDRALPFLRGHIHAGNMVELIETALAPNADITGAERRPG